MDKRQLNETRLFYIYFTGCCVWTRTFILCFNTLHLLQLPWAGVKLNHSSCVCSMVPRPHRSRRRGTRTGWTEKTNTCLWFRELTACNKKVTMSHLSLLSSVHCFGTLQVGTCGCSIRDQMLFSGKSPPPQPTTKFWHCSPSTVRKNSSGSNLTLSNGRRFEFPLWDTGTSWETTTI